MTPKQFVQACEKISPDLVVRFGNLESWKVDTLMSHMPPPPPPPPPPLTWGDGPVLIGVYNITKVGPRSYRKFKKILSLKSKAAQNCTEDCILFTKLSLMLISQ